MGTTGHQLRFKILNTIGSLQQQTVEGLYTPYQIWPHHSWLKRKGYQSKKNWIREQSTSSLFLITVDMSKQDFTTYLPGLPPSLTQDGLGHPVAPLRSFLYRRNFIARQGLRKRWHLLPGTTGHGHKPHAHLAVETQVQKSIPSSPDIATLPRVYA
jgi:hypothetical protein